MDRLFVIGLIGGVYMTLATVLGADFAIEVIGGDEAAPAAAVLELQALYLAPLFLNLVFQTAMLALRMHREMLIAAVIAVATMLALTLTLIPAYEARGAAIAVVAGEIVLAVVEAVLLYRYRRHLLPNLRVIPKVVVAATAAVAAGLVLDVHDVARVMLASVVYVGVLLVLRAIPAELGPALLRRGSGSAS